MPAVSTFDPRLEHGQYEKLPNPIKFSESVHFAYVLPTSPSTA
jgi:hypothetical protein